MLVALFASQINYVSAHDLEFSGIGLSEKSIFELRRRLIKVTTYSHSTTDELSSYRTHKIEKNIYSHHEPTWLNIGEEYGKTLYLDTADIKRDNNSLLSG